MTNEREHPKSVDETDALVSKTYGDMADEQTPDRLNKSVLRKAANAARPQYSRSMRWMRPAAWAATIAICLAITLQVTQVPVPESIVAPAGETALDNVSAPASEPVDNPAASDAETRNDDVDTNNFATLEAAVPSSVAEFEPHDTNMLQRAEDLARMQSGDNKESDQSSALVFAASEVAVSGLMRGCDDEAKAAPATWHACIISLEEAGLPDAARRQREELAEAFPDFEAP